MLGILIDNLVVHIQGIFAQIGKGCPVQPGQICLFKSNMGRHIFMKNLKGRANRLFANVLSMRRKNDTRIARVSPLCFAF